MRYVARNRQHVFIIMALSDYPDWVLAHKKPGVEIRSIRGKYYLYACSSYYDKEKKVTRKRTGEYLGRITEASGFIPRGSKRPSGGERPDAGAAPAVRDGECSVMEYGFYHFWVNAAKERYEPLLRKYFPDEWQSLLGASYCRAMRQSPLNRMESVYRRSYMSHVYTEAHLSPRSLTGFLRDMGRSRDRIVGFCRELLGGCRTIVFDGTDVLSASELMRLNSLQKTKAGGYDTLFNLMCCFSPDARIPVFYSIHPGKIKDSKAFKDCMDELMVERGRTMVVIDPDAGTELDKGFASGSNLEKLEEYGFSYVVSLRRNDPHLDYSCLERRDNSGMDVQFEYEGRPVWGKDLGPWGADHPERRVYLFYDPMLARQEEEDFAKHNEAIMGTRKYMEKFASASLRFGTIAMVSNRKGPDNGVADGRRKGKKGVKGATHDVTVHETVYYSYKERGTDEDMIRTLKTVVEADKTYMQDEIALEGWMFINFLALLWLYLIRDHIEDHGMLKRYSPAHVCDTFSGVNVLRIGDDWKLAGITANDQRVLKKLGLLPPIDEKYVCDDRSASDA